jgi:hypothetical protein
MLKRIALTVMFLTVSTFTIARPVAARSGSTNTVKVNTSTTAHGICYGKC